MRISIMQPYFLPYAGYFRLMCGVDAFVVLDDVQFPRGGWVHRNRLVRSNGSIGWLTLPLDRQPLVSTIRQMTVRSNALEAEWQRRVDGFPAGRWALGQSGPTTELLRLEPGGLVTNLHRGLRICAELLGLEVPFVLSSELGCDPALRGSDRVIAICRALSATGYVNAPGGRSLYDASRFAQFGIVLDFLPDYRGSEASILQRLFETPTRELRNEIHGNMT